ncbi:MAG: DNA recombination protein RmuC [Acidobacteriota bacterium]|nr:DNA recombination protein RmuC [Acidobacteriota bacterium]
MSFLEIAAIGILLFLAVSVTFLAILLRRRPSEGAAPFLPRLDELTRGQDRIAREMRDDLARGREESAGQSRALREETAASLRSVNDSVLKQVADLVTLSQQQMDGFSAQLGRLTESNELKFDGLRSTVETKLAQIQADNAGKLEEMRHTVDEKLEGTLERRLGESFSLVSERLEQVQKGLGEMQALASGVGDLKKVLSNVKSRGTWGEMQLGNLLADILVPDQYELNVATRPGSAERVEFAIKLPGRDDRDGKAVWLPIDAKFPKEDFERLVEAAERADPAAVEEAGKQLEIRLKAEAKDIRDKYLEPPYTTDFGILYLSTEGLYAEALRRPGLAAALQRDFRVNLTGPTTLAALLNSLQMGFRTLAIEKRSSEVWTVLGVVKTEFMNFGKFIEKAQKKIQEAGNVMDDARKKTKTIERKLRQVQELPTGETEVLMDAAGASGDEEEKAATGEPAAEGDKD